MDAGRFDDLLRSISDASTRRGIARAMAGMTLAAPLAALFGSVESEAKKKKGKRKKKKKCKGTTKKCGKKCIPSTNCCSTADCEEDETCEDGACIPTTTCSDSVKNGSESDVDCGGSCPRCINGKTCGGRDDCQSAFCASSVCMACSDGAQCGSDVNGDCLCEPVGDGSSKACNSATAEPVAVGTYCEECATDLNCLELGNEVWCVLPCGAA